MSSETPTAGAGASQADPPVESQRAEVAVFGLGYVGMTLAVALANAGVRVLGYDANRAVATSLAEGVPVIKEQGVEERLRELPPDRLQVVGELPDELPPAVVVCVGTPVHDATSAPDMRQLESATAALAERIEPDTLVVVRSTVPVGTTRRLLGEALSRRVPEPQLAFCPERTIQGRALEELHRLPQIVGANSPEAARRATELFSRLTQRIVPVSSLEAAEAIKLINNAHTDLIYGFGNEIALMAEAMGLDADELIASANADYPRPDIARPGFVGGACLTKDPYLLAVSSRAHGHTPSMILSARTLNEEMPMHSARRVLGALRSTGRRLDECRVLVSGIAFKGRPETDDVRGAASHPIIQLLLEEGIDVVGHDFAVSEERIAAMGATPVSLEEGFEQADAAMVLVDHARYRGLDFEALTSRMRRPAFVFDTFAVLTEQKFADGVDYLRLGSA